MKTPFAAAAVVLLFAGACATVRPPAGTAVSNPAAIQHQVAASDGHALALWEKRPAKPVGAILLVHGRTWSSLPNFDLPGRSLMDALAARGYDTYALDLRGYGATARDATGWLTPERAAADVAAALDWIGRRGDRPVRPVLLGLSRGASVSAFAAQRYPEKLSALVLLGFPADVDEKYPPTPPGQTPARKPNTAENAASDFITPGAIPRSGVDAFVAAALAKDPTRTDWRDEDQFNTFSPEAVKAPTLLIHGEHDPYAVPANQAKLFNRLGTGDREWVVVAGADHAVHLEDAQARLVAAVIDFIERHRSIS